MNKLFVIIIAVAAVACQQKPATGTFGEKFENTGASDFKSALSEYGMGKDTTYIISGVIENVCQGEGCWISFKNDSSEFLVNTHEKFSMPKNSKGKKAIAKGKFEKTEEGEVEFVPTGVIIE